MLPYPILTRTSEELCGQPFSMSSPQAAAQSALWGSRIQVPHAEMGITYESSTAQISLIIECCMKSRYLLSDRLQNLTSSQNYLAHFSQVYK